MQSEEPLADSGCLQADSLTLEAAGLDSGAQKLAPRLLHSWRRPCTALIHVQSSSELKDEYGGGRFRLRIDKILVVVGSSSGLSQST
jgi:hypothetical protein